MKKNLEDAINGDDELTIRTELKGGMGKYGRLLGWLYIGDDDVSLNEQMITEGYAWAYDGGTKQKNFEELREIRRSFGTWLIMWEFFQWAWNLDWGEGFALLAVLFAFYYGKKWIDNKFGSINQKQAKQLKRIIREAIDESELIDKIK